ncbi:MAG: fibro-slime domain-containing protein [Clostridiales bacterium]|nr:fibro-slime domain-containing protein [Clostridiales bacterium]
MMKKRFLLFSLVLVLIIGTFPVPISAEVRSTSLNVTIRDFRQDGKLFEGAITSMENLVRSQLGTDKKPVFSDPANPSQPLSGWQAWGTDEAPVTLDELNSLFNDVPGKNMTATQQLTLLEDADGYFSVDIREGSTENVDGYFPIDNQLFGNEENAHNYHFSVELHSNFTYTGAESFSFSGDDDVWVFVNNTLVVDLGGVHGEMSSDISIPELVNSGVLKIKKGDYVPFDIFYMERHTTGSNLFMKTNIDFTKYNASAWAMTEVDKGTQYDLIPASLKNADLTKNITREEFAELAVRLYEKTTGNTAVVQEPNPFIDTTNPEILKALRLGITKGTSADKFSPSQLINREQVASMLSRDIRIMVPDGDFSTEGAPLFTDQKDISSWALQDVLFMSKNNILKGSDGKFMPRAITTAQKAAGYANTTREQAIAMSVRIYDKYK